MKPVHAASTCIAGGPAIPSRAWTRQAVFGNTWSGVVVPSAMKSISDGRTPAAHMARRAAASARSHVVSLAAARCRRAIPVRLRIHSSVVSTMPSSSELVSTLSGRYAPVPMIFEYIRLPWIIIHHASEYQPL